ncbi:beta-1,3-galactosyltransferase 5-like [Pecten maximus]|uniref:beta-1,3-galactosyltransferase 5-like n=1 Tax=Pecten maximus TaxID=6579 RepID=UPI001458551E|nr:beta-1,3-galactosyltransferase 5-like [Pecten maximus]
MGKHLRNIFILTFVMAGMVLLQKHFQINLSWNKLNVIECIGCNKFEGSLIIEPPEVCKKYGGNTTFAPPELIFLVMSPANDKKSRNAIRDTWGGIPDQKTGNYRVVFVVGRIKSTDLLHEASEQRDILQLNVPDTQKAITERVAHSLRWLTLRCQSIKYVMKTNIEVFINVPYIFRILKKYDLKNSLAGHCYHRPEHSDGAGNDKRFKYLKSLHSPPYCSGSGYIIGRKTAVNLVEMFENTPYFALDDVYIGFCAYKAGVEIIDIPGFHVDFDGYDAFQYCHCVGSARNVDAGRQREIYGLQLKDCKHSWTRGVDDLGMCFLEFRDVAMPVTIMVVSAFLIALFLIVRRKLNIKP